MPRATGPATAKHYAGQPSKVMYHVQSGAAGSSGGVDGAKKQTGMGRGAPPPVPPNKPVVPPKKEAILCRRTELGPATSDQTEQKPVSGATTQGLKFGLTISKESGKIGSGSGNEEEDEGSRRDMQVGGSEPGCAVTRLHEPELDLDSFQKLIITDSSTHFAS